MQKKSRETNQKITVRREPVKQDVFLLFRQMKKTICVMPSALHAACAQSGSGKRYSE